jgi:hypothetical protein
MASPAALLVAALLIGAFPGCTSSRHASKTACQQARIEGKTMCLRPRERCDRRYERIYRSYGLTCRKGVLRERTYIGPANP